MMKGYVYTVFALLILIAVFIIIYLNAEASKNVNEFYNEVFRSQAIVFTIENLNEEFINNSFNMSLTYNLLLLTRYVSDPNNALNNEQEFYNAIKNLTLYGNYKQLKSNVSVMSLIKKIADEVKMRGIEINLDKIDLVVVQTDFDKLTYNYTIEFSIYDIYNKTGKRLSINGTNIVFDINGMPDPLFMRYARLVGVNLNGNYPAIFIRPNPTITLEISSGFGQGWVYGRVYTNVSDISNDDEPNILMGNFEYVKQYKDHPLIHGFIVTNFYYRTTKNCRYSTPVYQLANGDDTEIDIFNDIVHEEVEIPIYAPNGSIIGYTYECNLISPRNPTNKPWVAISGSSINLDINDYDNNTILILSNNPTGDVFSKYEGKLYRIEELRDFVNCGYYFKLPNRAPSYVQRFVRGGENLKSPYGIDILLIEDYFVDSSSVSSLLSERFSGQTGKPIRGLAGCKLTCNQPTKISQAIANYLGIDVLLKN